MDFGYFSFFNEHTTLMVYGILDDDTAALWQTMQANYNIFLMVIAVVAYVVFIRYGLHTLLSKKLKMLNFRLGFLAQLSLILLLLGMNVLVIRGTLGMQPLSKVIPDVSENAFINELPNNGVLAFIKATKLYKKSKSGNYDLIKSTHYTGRLNEAFSYLSQDEVKPEEAYIKAITHVIAKDEGIEKLKPHVVVIMVESFGLPIADYQSQEFNILGRLKKHFDEDTLFTNFISASNGTIVSLEPMMLNITARPNSTSLGQSKYQYTSFEQAAAKVYKKAGYETHFIYGGDLKWRNVGKFMSLQGFDKQSGKINISSALNIDLKKSSHDWGLFDEHSYDYVLKLLKEAKTPQFIFLLTTNNHPPFTVPKEYKAQPLECNSDLKSCMIGDQDLIQKRLRDYQYAVDMAGRFMDGIKESPLAKNTVVAITADNNTIEGRIRYKDSITTSKKIPFYLYAPESIRKKDVNTSLAGSHKDLFATLYNQSLSNTEYISVGKNLFNPQLRHCGFNDVGIIVSNEGAFKHHKPKNKEQEKCDKEYDAALAVSDWLIRIYPQTLKKN
jgi:phosphoglycerol transferase MdoB-like AlkP superfamily enzyme